MNDSVRSVRGMSDVLPGESALLRRVEACCIGTFESFGYREIRLPLLEKTGLFARSIGETSDIVRKEMYTFEDRNGESLTLRPEGTAGCVRAAVEHGLLGGSRRLWYAGPFFRRERPQKGRRRQFHQAGVEVFGVAGADADAEVIALADGAWRCLGVGDVQLRLNSLGTEDVRARYRRALVAHLESRASALADEARLRLRDNPLRLLDSKDPAVREATRGAPLISDYLDPESRAHFDELQRALDDLGVAFTLDPLLVRGLDYYTKTVFEWVVPDGGSQSAVCAGGRYDGLVERLGGRATPAVGCAFGVERVALLLEHRASDGDVDVYAVAVGEQARRQTLRVARQLRERMPRLRLMVHCGGGSLKAQLRHADKSRSKLALIIGDDEVRDGVVTIKDLRGGREQQRKPLGELPSCIENHFSRERAH